MISLLTSTSRVLRATLVCVCQYFLIFTPFPLVSASGASEQDPTLAQLIPDSLISLGSEGGRACAIIVEKNSQSLMVYEHQDTFSLKHVLPCSTGEVAGKKKKSGDRKTPEGVYFLTKAFEKRYLSATYGNRAFVMDYPNFLDRKFNRGGNNIWLHGSDKPIKARDSNGCVVMANDDLETLAQCIELNRTPVIIKQKLNMVRAESQLAAKKSLNSFLEGWQTAFVTGDRVKYSACYSKPSGDHDTLWREWNRLRTSWQRAQIPFDMRLQNLTLVRDNPCVVALLDQSARLGAHVSVLGTKKLFLEKNGRTWKIMGEEYQPSESNHGSNGLLVTALSRLDQLQRDHKAIADLVDEWADAWSSKDIRQYRACYDPGFQAQGMDLSAWIRYKESLNRRYDSIRIWIEDLRIQQGPERSTVTFLQRYLSSGHQSVGIKCLRLRRIGGTWKIDRETWQEQHK